MNSVKPTSTATAIAGAGTPASITSEPKRKKVIVCSTAPTLSLNWWKAAGVSRSATPSAIPATKAAIRPLPIVDSASPKAARPIPSA